MSDFDYIYLLCQDKRPTTSPTTYDKFQKISARSLSSLVPTFTDLQKAYDSDIGGDIILTTAKPLQVKAPSGDNDQLLEVLSNDGTSRVHLRLETNSTADTKLSAIGGDANGSNSCAIGDGSSVNIGATGAFIFSDGSAALENTRANSILLNFNSGLELVNGTTARGTAGNSVNYRLEQAETTTTNNTTTTLFSYQLPSDTVIGIEAKVSGIRTGGSAGSEADSIDSLIHAKSKYTGATISTTPTTISNISDNINFAVTIDDDSTDTVRVRVTGDTNYNMTWHCTVIIREYKYV